MDSLADLKDGDVLTVGNDPHHIHVFPDGTKYEYVVTRIGESVQLNFTQQTAAKIKALRRA